MPRLTIEGDAVIDSTTGAVVTMGKYRYDQDGAYCAVEYATAGRTFEVNLGYDQYRPDLCFRKPPSWNTGEELTEPELAQAKEVLLLALRKRRLDPMWDPPYVEIGHFNDNQEWKRIERLRKQLFPPRSMWRKWQDTKV